MSITLYGIPNCDSVKKAKKWLEKHNITYQFHDFRKGGLTIETVGKWLEFLPAEIIVNKRSTTWKKLSDVDKNRIETDLSHLLIEHPTLIKRPVLTHNMGIELGFNEPAYQQLFN